jgi:ribonuclease M5
MNKIIIVEGKSDTRRLKEIFKNIQTFETSGLGYDKSLEEKLVKLSKNNEFIIFTDPDGPGEIIRERITRKFPQSYHAYLPNDKALSKKQKVGIEHGSDLEIKKALNNLYQVNENISAYILEDMIDIGIYNSREKRKLFCDNLCIAYGNNKKVLKQLNDFSITPEEIAKAIRSIDESS